jgi:hypothetical protein
MFSILKDIKSGALPKEEILPFLLWLIGRSFWPIFAVLVVAAIILLAMR